MTNDPSKAAVTESNEEFIARMKATCIAAGMQDAQPDPVYLLVPFNLEIKGQLIAQPDPVYLLVPFNYCHAGQDGDCTWKKCPQLRDKEPNKTGRHCPNDLLADAARRLK